MVVVDDVVANCAVNKKGKVAFKRSEEVGLPPQIVQQSSKDSSTEGSVNGSVMSGTSSTSVLKIVLFSLKLKLSSQII